MVKGRERHLSWNPPLLASTTLYGRMDHGLIAAFPNNRHYELYYLSTVVPEQHQSTVEIPTRKVFRKKQTQAETVAEPDEIGKVIEEIVDLIRQINLEVESDDVQEKKRTEPEFHFIRT
ncbi:hypothetical protein TNCV_1372921 [Trichonephila clavipes]|uniref:Uncharacterized protein n=1 Tax=Trichonephila clavipes TaxID=2585209 RepID=A0A8X6WIS3_TRICX|nr:hypothetical protein TNCV_1372921 [Trichonephila clavipes]